MSYQRKDGCCTRKNATTNVDVLTVVLPDSRFRYGIMIVSSVCQDVIAPTDISSESIVVIVTVWLLHHRSVQYPGVKPHELCINSSYRLTG